MITYQTGLDYARRLHRDGATWDDLTVRDDDAHVEAWELEQLRAEAMSLAIGLERRFL